MHEALKNFKLKYNKQNSDEKTSNIKCILISLLVMALWGSLFPFVQLGYAEFNIDTSNSADLVLFAGIRFLISGIIISLFCTAKQPKSIKMNRTGMIGIALTGFFAVAVHYACTYLGLAQIEGSKTALLKQSGVLVFICFSFLFFKEDKLTVGKIIGAVLGVVSILVVNMNAFKFDFNFGTILVISASICTVVSNVVYKKMLVDVSSIVSTGFSQLFGGILLTVCGLAFGGRISSVSTKAILIFTYIIIATVVSYSLWYMVVKKYQLSKLFIIKMSEPLFAAVLSVVLLGTKLTINHLVAFLLVFAAVLFSNTKLRKVDKNYESNVG